MKSKSYWTARSGNVKVPVHKRQRVKKGRTYTSYTVAEHRDGKRHLLTFADVKEAEEKAQSIADSTAEGVQKTATWGTDYRLKVVEAQRLILDAGFAYDDFPGACRLLRDACKAAGGADQLMAAAQAWASANHVKKFAPTLVSKAVEDFLERRKGRVNPRKLITDKGRLNKLVAEGRHLHEIGPSDLSDILDKSGWAVTTRNAALKLWSLFFDDCIARGYAAVNPASIKHIKRGREKIGAIGIYAPAEAKAIMSAVDEDLRAFLALWFWSGLRKEEASKMTFPELHAALHSSSIYLPAEKSKVGQDRSVPIEPNLRKWLEKYAKPSGYVLPERWRNNLGALTGYVAEKAKIAWVPNAPRHSFASYSLARGDAPALVSAAMGNSLAMLQKHYWARSRGLNRTLAEAWFSIKPDDCAADSQEQQQSETPLVKA